MPEAFPLQWPLGFPRTRHRHRSPFTRRGVLRAWTELHEELDRLGAQRVTVSTNVRTRLDGRPYADGDNARPADPGVAVYFTRRIRDPQTRRFEERPFAIACDQYEAVWENLRALYLTIDSLRRIERHGSSRLMEQAFQGFQALTAAPDHQPPWREVLGPAATRAQAEARYRELMKAEDHSQGSEDERKRRLNLAVAEARAELG